MMQGDWVACFNNIVSELEALGRKYTVAEQNTKILAWMLKEDWFVKVTTLKGIYHSTILARVPPDS